MARNTYRGSYIPRAVTHPQADDGDDHGGLFGLGFGPELNLGVGTALRELGEGVSMLANQGLSMLTPAKDGMGVGEFAGGMAKGITSSIVGTAETAIPGDFLSDATAAVLGEQYRPQDFMERATDRGILPALIEDVGNVALVGSAITAPVKGAALAAKATGATNKAAQLTAIHQNLISKPLIRAAQHPYRVSAESVRSKMIAAKTARDAELGLLSAGPAAGLTQRFNQQFGAELGLEPFRHVDPNVKADPEAGRAMAAAYEGLPDIDDSPETQASFQAYAEDIERQFDWVQENAKVRFEFVDEDPYASHAELMEDVRKNGRMKVFRTKDGDHPYLTPEQNDKFRAVHDLIGHLELGNDFSRHGEEAAWALHAQMFRPEARRAMTTETRGQNSWLNFSEHNEARRAAGEEAEFGAQKVALLPEEFSAREDAYLKPTTPLDRILAKGGDWAQGVEARRRARDEMRVAETARRTASRSTAMRLSTTIARDHILNKAKEDGLKLNRKQAELMVGEAIENRITGVQALVDEALERGVNEDLLREAGVVHNPIPAKLHTPELEKALTEAVDAWIVENEAARATLLESRRGDEGLADPLAQPDAMTPTLTRSQKARLSRARRALERADRLNEQVLRQRERAGLEILGRKDRIGRIARELGNLEDRLASTIEAFDHSRSYVPKAWKTKAGLQASVQAIHKATLEGGGASFDPHVGRFLELGKDDGYMVAILPKTILEVPVDEFTPAHVQQVVDAYQDLFQSSDVMVGTWIEDGTVHIDLSERVDNVDDALIKGGARQQIAITDMARGTFPSVPLRARPDIAAAFLDRNTHLKRVSGQVRDALEASGKPVEDAYAFQDLLMREAVRAADLGKVAHPDDFFRRLDVQAAKRRSKRADSLPQIMLGKDLSTPAARQAVWKEVEAVQKDLDTAMRWYDRSHEFVERLLRGKPEITLLDGQTKIDPADLTYQLLAVTSVQAMPRDNFRHTANVLRWITSDDGKAAAARMGKVFAQVSAGKLSLDDALQQITGAPASGLNAPMKNNARGLGIAPSFGHYPLAEAMIRTVLSGQTMDKWTPEFIDEVFKKAWGKVEGDSSIDEAWEFVQRAYPEFVERATKLVGEGGGWKNARTGQATAYHVTDPGNVESILAGGLEARATDARGTAQVEGFKNPGDAWSYGSSTGTKGRVVVEYQPSEVLGENFGVVKSGSVPPSSIAKITDVRTGEVLFEQTVVDPAVKNQAVREYWGSDQYTKIQSFWDNLRDPANSQAVTMDMWMARLIGIHDFTPNPAVVGELTSKGTPGTKAAWLQAAENIRAMARELTDRLGRQVMPHQVQAALWGYANSRIAQIRTGHMVAFAEDAREAILSGEQLVDGADPISDWLDEYKAPYADDAPTGITAYPRRVRLDGETVDMEVQYDRTAMSTEIGKVEGKLNKKTGKHSAGWRERWLKDRDAINEKLAAGDVDGAAAILDTWQAKMFRALDDEVASGDFLHIWEDPAYHTDALVKAVNSIEDVTGHQLGEQLGLLQSFDDHVLGEFLPALSDESRATIRLFESGNLATLVHENGHLLRRWLPDAEMRTVEGAYGVKAGKWTPQAEERFANDFLKYLARTEAPAGLEGTFARVRSALKDIFDMVMRTFHRGKVQPEVADIFDRWLNPEEKAVVTDPERGTVGLELPAAETGTRAQIGARAPHWPEVATKPDFYQAGRKGAKALAEVERLAKRRRQLEQTKTRLEKDITELQEVLEAGMTKAEIQQRKLRGAAARMQEKVQAQLGAPSMERTPTRWQPLYQAYRDLAAHADQNPAIAEILGDASQALPTIQALAMERGFNPAHVSQFSPTQIRRLVYGNMQLGLGRQVTEDKAGARNKRTGQLQRMGVQERSLSALLAASIDATVEARTNAVIDYVEKGVARRLPKGAPVPEGWVPWSPSRTFLLTGQEVSQATGELVETTPVDTMVVPEVVAKMLRREVSDHDHWAYTAIGKITSPWRAFVLTLNPGWYVRNFAGNVAMAMADGVSLRDWKAAWESFKSQDEMGRFADVPFVAGDTLANEAGTLAHEQTTIPAARGRAGLTEAMDESGRIKGATDYVMGRLQRVNGVVDEFARAAVYHKGRRLNMSQEQAWKHASEALVDYQNLSPFERKAVRSVIPFYSWQKGILKVTANQALDHPARAAILQQLGQMQQDYVADLFGVDDADDVPGYYRHIILRDRNIRAWNPFADTSEILSPEGIARSMNPFLEVATRKGLGAPEFFPESYRLGQFGTVEADVDVAGELADMTAGTPVGRVVGGDAGRVLGMGLHAQDTERLRQRILESRERLKGIPAPERQSP